MVEFLDGGVGEYLDCGVDGFLDGGVGEYLDGRVDGFLDGGVGEYLDGGVGEYLDGGVGEYLDGGVGEYLDGGSVRKGGRLEGRAFRGPSKLLLSSIDSNTPTPGMFTYKSLNINENNYCISTHYI